MQSKNSEHIDVKALVKAWADGRHLEITDPKERIAIFKEEFEQLAKYLGEIVEEVEEERWIKSKKKQRGIMPILCKI